MQNARYASLGSTISDQDVALSQLASRAGGYHQGDSDWHERPYKWDDRTSARPHTSLGLETKKQWISSAEVFVLIVSWSSCVAATVVVANGHSAWSLGVQYQLVIVGFLLSIMNICLSYVAPTLFLRLEARLGASTLQNYEALLRNRPFASKADWTWRIVLFLLAILPLGLSALYKLFIGGHSTFAIKSNADLHSNAFGAYAPPGMQPLAQNTGMSLMVNASTPFVQATSTSKEALVSNATYGDPAFDPPIPVWPQPYGFNTLVLNASATALLDAPPPTWVDKVRDVLQEGESWNISAAVTATISTYNASVEAHRNEYYPPPDDENRNSTFWDLYNWQGGMKSSKLYNGWNIGFISNEDLSHNRDQSWCFVGIFPDPLNDNLTTFAPVAKMYDTQRRPCRGTWTITQGGIQLVNGTCDLDPGAQFARDQIVFQENQFFLSDYLPFLVEYLGPFATVRNQSQWLDPTVTTTIASIMWSRLTSRNGPGSASYSDPVFTASNGTKLSQEDVGLVYESPAMIYSTRPTLKKSPGLFVLLAIQPVIMSVMLVIGMFMYSVPIGKGFGIIAVLAGVDRKSLDVLEGAELSGRLIRKVGLDVLVDERSRRVSYAVNDTGLRTRSRIR